LSAWIAVITDGSSRDEHYCGARLELVSALLELVEAQLGRRVPHADQAVRLGEWSGFNSTPWITLKIAVVAPIPSAQLISLMQILRITNARLAIEFREMEVDPPRNWCGVPEPTGATFQRGSEYQGTRR
jgi:hypothetical protein